MMYDGSQALPQHVDASAVVPSAGVGDAVMLARCARAAALIQSVLHASGPRAASTAHLWWFAFIVAAVVYVLTLARCSGRSRGRAGASATASRLRRDAEQRMKRGVALGARRRRVVILLVFLGYDLSVARTRDPVPKQHPLTIEVTGQQWWWEVTYADTSAHGRFTTANEIHIPVGQPVLFLLSVAAT